MTGSSERGSSGTRAAATQHVVCPEDDLPPGGRVIVELEGRSIGVFNVDGRYYALRNVCPHRGAPLCLGTIGGTMLPSDPKQYHYGLDRGVLRCPWHGWEIELESGRAVFDPVGTRVKTYPVSIVDGSVVVEL